MDTLAKLKQLYPEREESLLRAVATDIRYSGEDITANSEVVEKLFRKWETRKTEGRVSAESADFCPICKSPMKPVKLDNDRDATWCSKHQVVFPVRAKG